MSCIIKEVSGDLFSCPNDTSMAHCVAEDMKMGKGIAVKFRDLFGQVQHLKNQNIKSGGVAVIKDQNRYIYYLITKQSSYQKPTYQSLASSLEAMKDHMNKCQIKKLAIPRIGCGLDGLVWNKVKDLIYETFLNTDIDITVYNYSAQ